MTLERLSEFMGGSYEKSYLQRIFLAGQLETKLKALANGPLRVSVRPNGRIVINAASEAQAAFLRLQRRKIYGLAKGITPALKPEQIVIRLNRKPAN